MSTTSKSPSQLDLWFSYNSGPDEVLVYQGAWGYQTQFSGPASGPKDFDIQLKLQTPFIYDPKKGNLMVDLQIFGAPASRTFNIDGTGEGDHMGRVYIVAAPSFLRAEVSDLTAPVMQIVYEEVGERQVLARGTAQLVNGSVMGVNLISGGSGYTNTPAVRFFGGGGSGASATAVVRNGVVVAINVESAGRGYTSTPAVKIASPGGLPGLNIKTKRVTVELFLVLGRRYRLDSSRDLVSWSNVETFVAEDEVLSRDFDVLESGQYFRVIEVE